MLEIKRNGLIITPNGHLDASAGSYDVPVTLINDDTYSDYVINMFVGWYARGILKKRKAEIDSDGNYLIPKEAFQHKGMINISFLLEKKDKTQGLMTNALGYQVKNTPNVIIEVPADPSWEELVREWCAELINATIPIISVSKKDGATTLNITDINGTKTVLIEDGYTPVKGVDYTDGISPTVSVKQITEGSGGYKISITDANGTKTIDILNGSNGSDANVTDENIKKALGFTPAKQEDVNKLSNEIVDLKENGTGSTATTEEIVAEVLVALGTPMVGSVDENNVITLGGELADGTYTLRYYNQGEYVEIGTLTLSSGSVDTPPNTTIVWEVGTKIDTSTGAETTGTTTYSASNYIKIVDGYTYTITKNTTRSGGCKVVYYDADKNFISTSSDVIVSTTSTTDATIPLIDGASYFRVRLYDTASLLADGDYTLTAKLSGNDSSDTEEITNYLYLGTTTLGGTEIYNGVGYKDGTRWSNSSKAPSDSGDTACYLTGIIPATEGDTIYTCDLAYASANSSHPCYFVKYGSDGSIISDNITSYSNIDENGVASFTIPSGVVAFRLMFYDGVTDSSMITINQYPK